MKASEFIKKLQDIVDNYKTLYVMGCFGAPLTGDNVSRYCTNHSYNKQAARTAMIKAAANKNPPVFGFDCVCMIKGVLWGWNGDASKTYGGASYAYGGVPDIGADTMITKCSGVSTNFSKIIPGEAVWMKGHIGVYIGGGKMIECSPAFKNCVQVTACLNIGAISGMNGRRWTKHGKLPYITYDTAGAATGGAGTAQKPNWALSATSGALAFAVGNVVRFTGNQHFTSANAASGKACKPGKAKVTAISKGAKHPYHLIKENGGRSTVYGWVNAADVQSEADAAIDKLAGLGVINSPDYWKNAVAAGTVQYLDLLFIGAAEYIKKAGPRCATPQAGVDALAKAGVINSPDYWLQNYGKLQSLGALLCALGGSV